MQVKGMDNLKVALSEETSTRKTIIAASSIWHFLCSATLGGIYLAWFVNANKMQDAYEEFCKENDAANGYCDLILYNIAWQIGPFSDKEKALEYSDDLIDSCDTECRE